MRLQRWRVRPNGAAYQGLVSSLRQLGRGWQPTDGATEGAACSAADGVAECAVDGIADGGLSLASGTAPKGGAAAAAAAGAAAVGADAAAGWRPSQRAAQYGAAFPYIFNLTAGGTEDN
eukprot:1727735-Prymnesium_polylepis.2